TAVVQPKIADCAAFLTVAPFGAIGMGWVDREADYAESLDKPLYTLLLTEEMALFRTRPEVEQVLADQMPGARFVELLLSETGGVAIAVVEGVVAARMDDRVPGAAPDLWIDAEIPPEGAWSDDEDEGADRGPPPPPLQRAEPAAPPPPMPPA